MKYIKKFLAWLGAASIALVASQASAQLNIEITGGGANRIPIAIAPFGGEGGIPKAIVSVIKSDLERSGAFRVVDGGNDPLPEGSIDFSGWKGRGADAVVTGIVAGGSEARFKLFDTPKMASLGGLSLPTSQAQARVTGHRIADYIYEKLTGESGVFNTRIAYVVKSGPRYYLQVADMDGANPQTAVSSREAIISPSWSPDGTKVAYVSFESQKPVVYVQNLVTGTRTAVANFRGSNSAPAWSPDGHRLAVTLSRDGGSQIFLINADGSNPRRLTSGAINTEPSFAPDGKTIYFTSDRGGSPQVYRMGTDGGDAQRVTFGCSYCVSPKVSPDGKTLAFIARNEGRYQLSIMNLESRQVQVVTDSVKDESPSWAPNGRVLLYATEVGGRGVLGTVAADGRTRQRLTIPASDVREPTWGPRNN